MNPLLAIDRHALREIAGNRRFDQIVDLGLDRLLDRLVLPFDDRSGAFAVLVNDRRSDMLEFQAADRNVGFAGSGQRVHQLALMRNILVEHVHVDADELLAVKIRQLFAQFGIGVLQHLLHGRVHVHDVVTLVGDHHVRTDHVERRAHAQIDDLLRNRLLEDLSRLGDIADFIAARGIRHIDDAVIGEIHQHAGHLAERPTDRDHAEYGRTDEDHGRNEANRKANPLHKLQHCVE